MDILEITQVDRQKTDIKFDKCQESK